MTGQQIRDLRDQLRRKSSAIERHDFNHFNAITLGSITGPSQRDAALPARSVGGKKKHCLIFLSRSIEIRSCEIRETAKFVSTILPPTPAAPRLRLKGVRTRTYGRPHQS